MPELPEVTTTVNGLNKYLPKLIIKDVWSDFHIKTKSHAKNNIKYKKYFEKFREELIGKKFINSERRGKNIFINLSSGKTILIHMKMTGHLLYGKYEIRNGLWTAINNGPLKDPFNRFIHLVFTLSNKNHLVLSDMRKFAKVSLFDTKDTQNLDEILNLGPEPLSKLTFASFKKQLFLKPKGKIKTVLMDQKVLAGIGNIYSDEILWESRVKPERKPASLTNSELKRMWLAMKKILNKSIKMGGDSMSDYRNIDGEKGRFQENHNSYRKHGTKCNKNGCTGKIVRKKIGGRNAHFCNAHQI